MASPWDRLGWAASVMQVTGVVAISGLVSMVMQAVHIARRNRKQCQELAKHVDIVGSLLPKLQIPELRRHRATRLSLDQLHDALLRAFMLVRSCSQLQQKSSQLYQMITGADVADKLRQTREEIDCYVTLIAMITTVAGINNRATYQDDETNDLTPQATYQDDGTNDLTQRFAEGRGQGDVEAGSGRSGNNGPEAPS